MIEHAATAEQQLKELQSVLNNYIDVSDYSTANAANDIEEVRKAMGFESIAYSEFPWNGIGMTHAYTYPEHVAGLILDGVVDIHQPMGEHVEEDANILECFQKDVIKIFVVQPNHDKVFRIFGKTYLRILQFVIQEPMQSKALPFNVMDFSHCYECFCIRQKQWNCYL